MLIPFIGVPVFQRGSPQNKDERVLIVVVVLVLSTIVGLLIFQKIQYYRTQKEITVSPQILKSSDYQNVNEFIIYPKVMRPSGGAIKFMPPNQMIEEFFQSISDIRAYSGSRYTVASPEHTWFLEIIGKDKKIQVSFTIPSEKDNIVIGRFGKYENTQTFNYGEFQSRQLFQWYQTYKDRWLSPAAPPPGATATPTPP